MPKSYILSKVSTFGGTASFRAHGIIVDACFYCQWCFFLFPLVILFWGVYFSYSWVLFSSGWLQSCLSTAAVPEGFESATGGEGAGSMEAHVITDPGPRAGQ